MWCEKILRNTSEACNDPEGRTVDLVDVAWHECGRLLKKQSRGGEAVRLLMPSGERIRHGDVIFEDESRIVQINILPCEMIIARPIMPRDMVLLALELGNLHWPVQVEASEMMFIEDEPVMDVLRNLRIPWSVETRRFAPTDILSAPALAIKNEVRLIRSQKNGQTNERAD